jgi:hypothetical protein
MRGIRREYHAVTDADLARARRDAPFRQQMIVDNLDLLLAELNRLRNQGKSLDKTRALQMREGAMLAVKLADLLHQAGPGTTPLASDAQRHNVTDES